MLETIKLVKSSGSNDVVIVFSSRGVEKGKFTFFKSLSTSNKNVIFINDHESKWYLNGTPEFNSYGRLLDKIRELIQSLQLTEKSITCIGTSMGGYAALRYGRDLCADTIIALGPELQLKLPLSRSENSIAGENLDDSDISEVTYDSRVFLLYGSNDLNDLYHASKFQHHNVKQSVYVGQNCNHEIAVNINKEMPIGDFFTKIIDEKRVPKLSFLNNHRITFAEALIIYDFYQRVSEGSILPLALTSELTSITSNQYATFYKELGKYLLSVNMLSEAETALKNSIRIDDRPSLPVLLLARIYNLNCKFTSALNLLQPLAERAPTISVCLELIKASLNLNMSVLTAQTIITALELAKTEESRIRLQRQLTELVESPVI
ncbi:tetratricopeptide repeat protein [Catenovulum sp. SX2]|uniref:tetratricopeptide repeat protein n=1 Tax=Catenovulum sp. SX2 TaxID=3398614 RepID=UPI003F82FA61